MRTEAIQRRVDDLLDLVTAARAAVDAGRLAGASKLLAQLAGHAESLATVTRMTAARATRGGDA